MPRERLYVYILVSNDDGYHATGIRHLVDAIGDLARTVVVAPDRDRSGASNSLTLDSPLRGRQESEGVYCVNGTPTDCVHLAITGLLEDEPDMVLSGINHGANLGDDVLYSGTVAAATEGRFLGLPAVAFSLSGDIDYLPTAARVAAGMVRRLSVDPLPADTILNVNVPGVDYPALRGFRATGLGNRHKAEPMVSAVDPRGHRVHWVGPAGPEQDAGEGTDFHAVANGYVSVTPLQVDLTRHDAVPDMQRWLDA